MTILDSSIYEQNKYFGPQIWHNKTMTYLFAFYELNFEELVYGLFVIQGIHDCEIDDTSQIREVRRCVIFNTLLFGNSYNM